jgi:hypothetical protein
MTYAAKILPIVLSLMLAACSQQSDTPGADTKAPAPAATAVPAIQIVNWGPRSTPAGKGFAVQPNGNSAIWFEARGVSTANPIEVWFGDRKLEGMALIPDKGGSAEVPPELIAKPGGFPIYLKEKSSGTRVDLGTFEVTAN